MTRPMGKPSSALKKKKRSKISSKARIKKRSKSRTRRSSKLKKHRRRHDSVSYSSDGDKSTSSVSISSSSSEDDYRSKRSRSRTRKDVKGSKKRARRRSSSSESIEDSTRGKKRKRSKKNDEFRLKKKRHGKKKMKKSKRDVSVSSTSRGSQSCSTCHSSSDEHEIDDGGRYEKKHNDRRRVKVKNESKRRRSRSRSSSSCHRSREYSDHTVDDKVAYKVNSRRLRSVVTVVREGKDLTRMFYDEHKEEMVYDHDYPPTRSNDSDDGGSKKELVCYSHVASLGKNQLQEEKGEAVVSDIRTYVVTEGDMDIVDQDGSNPHSDGNEKNDDLKGKQDSGGVDGVGGCDLEMILRQKALENLRIRRGRQTDGKTPDVISHEVNTLSTNSGSSQNALSNGGFSGVIGANHVKIQSTVADLPMTADKISDRDGDGKGYGSSMVDVQHPPGLLALADKPMERISLPVSAETKNARLVVLASKPGLSTCTTKKQLQTVEEPRQAKPKTKNHVDKGVVEAMPTVNPLSGNNNGDEINNTSTSDDPSSCAKSPCGGSSPIKPQNETKEGSQYQQKTMTVMRGGEMVEVSYKVYIPKKAPALSRRPLKR